MFEAKTQNSCLEFLYTHVSVCSAATNLSSNCFDEWIYKPQFFSKKHYPLNHQAKTIFSKNSDLSLPTRETGASVSGIPKFWSEFRYHLLHWQNADRKSRKITKIRCSKTIRLVLFFNFSGIKVNSVQEACAKCFT